MKTATVTEEASKIIQEQHDSFTNTGGQNEHIEDRITKKASTKNPECLVIEKEAEWSEKAFMDSIQEELDKAEGCRPDGTCCILAITDENERTRGQEDRRTGEQENRRIVEQEKIGNLPTKAKDILTEVCTKGKMSTVIEIPRELKEVAEGMRGEEAEDMWKDLREAKYVIRSNGVGKEEKETVMRGIQRQREESKEREEDEELGGGPEQDEMREEPRIEDLEEREEDKNESGSALDQQNKDRERQIRGKRKREEGTSRNNQKKSAREETSQEEVIGQATPQREREEIRTTAEKERQEEWKKGTREIEEGGDIREIHILENEDGNNSLGTNRIEWTADRKKIEIIRDFRNEEVDTLNDILGKIIEEIPIEDIEMSEEEEDEGMEDDGGENETRRSDNQERTKKKGEIMVIDDDQDKDRIIRAQQACEETKDIREVIEKDITYSYKELQTRSKYFKELYGMRDNLKMEGEGMYVKSLNDENEETSRIVIPHKMAVGIVTRYHKTLAHANTWRLREIISKNHFIADIRGIARKVQKYCKDCLLALPARVQKIRKIPNASSTPGEGLSMDILYLPTTTRGYGYLLVVVDMATNFIYTEALKDRTSSTVAGVLNTVIQRSARTADMVETDLGKEFIGETTKALMEIYHMKHEALPPLLKNCVKAEVANVRITNLLRKMLPEGKSWLEAYRSVTFALNITSMKFGNIIASPAKLLYGSQPCIPLAKSTGDDRLDIALRSEEMRETMDKIAKIRNVDEPSLYITCKHRLEEFVVGEKCLTWREFVLTQRLLHSQARKAKIMQKWCLAEVISKSGNEYVIRTSDGKQRTMHRRAMKKIPSEVIGL